MWPGRTLDEVVRILKINLNQLFFFIFTNKLIEVMQCSVQLKLTHPLSVRILKPQASLASQTQPTPAQTDSSCLILKAIRAGVGWVWLARLALGMVLFFFCDIDRAKQTTSVSCVVTMGNLRECLICYYLLMLFSITPSIGYSGARWVDLTNQKDAASSWSEPERVAKCIDTDIHEVFAHDQPDYYGYMGHGLVSQATPFEGCGL